LKSILFAYEDCTYRIAKQTKFAAKIGLKKLEDYQISKNVSMNFSFFFFILEVHLHLGLTSSKIVFLGLPVSPSVLTVSFPFPSTAFPSDGQEWPITVL
jgi:hypothetical protein